MARGTDVVQAALAAIRDHYALNDDTTPLPKRHVTTAGQVAYDDEQLSVTLASYYFVPIDGPGINTGIEPLRPAWLWRGVEVEVALIRCAPALVDVSGGQGTRMRLPTEDEYADWLGTVDSDLDHLQRAIRDGADAGAFGIGFNVGFLFADVYGPQGELGGAIVRFRVAP